MFGLAALAAGLTIIALQAQRATNAWSLVPALLVCGLGIGCIFAPMSNVTMGSVRPQLAGTASGIYNTSRQVGGVLGSAAIGVLLQARITTSISGEAAKAALSLPEQYRTAFLRGIGQAASATSEFGPDSPGESGVPGLPRTLLPAPSSSPVRRSPTGSPKQPQPRSYYRSGFCCSTSWRPPR